MCVSAAGTKPPEPTYLSVFEQKLFFPHKFETEQCKTKMSAGLVFGECRSSASKVASSPFSGGKEHCLHTVEGAGKA